MKTLRGWVLFGAVALFPLGSIAQGWSGNANLFLGAKALDEDDWEPAEDHREAGILVDFKQDNWPVSFAVDLLRSEGDGSTTDRATGISTDLDVETTELNAGVRKIWDQTATNFSPYVGGGLAFISLDSSRKADGLSVSDDDSGVGFWIDGGAAWTVNQVFNIGLDLRYSRAEVTIADVDAEAGGGHAGLLLGYHW